MPLHLVIENETSLPDGGPIRCTVTNKRGIDIGRDQYLDWVLPDPTRMISGKHCEIRFRDGRYWLIDVSTNGTFVNRSEFRLPGPHALNTGDRIEIGRFIIAVTVEPEEGAEMAGGAPAMGAAGPADSQLWNVGGDVAPAINPRELRAPIVTAGIGSYDVLDWAASVPPVQAGRPVESYAAPYQPERSPSPAQYDWGLPDVPPPVATPQPSRPSQPAAPAAAPAAPAPILPVAAPFQPLAAPPAAAPQGASPAPAASGFLWDVESESRFPPASPAPQRDTTEPPPHPVTPAIEPQASMPEPTGAAPAAEPAPAPPSMPRAARPAATAADADILRRFAQGAGMPETALTARNAGDLAELLGGLMRMTMENLRQLQMARTQSKGLMRSSNHTMIQATDNNPLRFSPTTEDAFRIMFGPRTSSYLGPKESLDQSFTDLKKHQMLLFTAMQTALKELLQDFDPEQIAARVDQDKGFGGLLNSRKAKQWDRFETAWKAKVGKNEQGMLGVFMLLFAEAYDKSSH